MNATKDQVIKTVELLGFIQPAQVYTKPDARGSEYGWWSVCVLAADKILVEHNHNDGPKGLNYSFVFESETDFRCWAQETTLCRESAFPIGAPDKAKAPVEVEKRYDVTGSIFEIGGTGSDGAYDMHFNGGTPADIAEQLRECLTDGFSLSNSKGPFRMSLHIGPFGSADDLPIG